MPLATFNNANMALQQRKLEDAIALYDAALRLKPDFVEALTNKGVALRLAGRGEEAVAAFEAALRHRPSHVSAHVNKGNALKDLGHLDAALVAYDAALKLDRAHADALANKGVVLRALKRPAEALAHIDKALALKPQLAMAHNARGTALIDLKRPAEALQAFETASQLVPAYPEALCNRGHALRALKRNDEALEAFRLALSLRPAFAEALTGLGEVLVAMRRYEEALAVLTEALTLQPSSHEALNQKGLALVMLGRQEEGLACYAEAISLSPQTAEYHNNAGFALQELGRLEEAQAAFGQALSLDPSFADARTNRGIVRLLQGDWAQGFADFESRWDSPSFLSPRAPCKAPLWQGERVGHLLVFGEQGLGDHLQFVRFLTFAQERADRVTFACTPKLHHLFARAFPDVTLVSTVMPDDRFDAMIALMSLPHLFGTTLDTVPSRVPYLFADPELVASWREKIGRDGFKVGLVWQGNPQADVDRGRSLPLSLLAPLAQEGVRLIALQKGAGLKQIDGLPPGMKVEVPEAFDEGEDAFADSAAVIANLDLIVTTDTSMAHLSGALGKETIVLLKHVPDWRWLMERGDSPFYPSLNLSRQSKAGDWSVAVAGAAQEIQRKRML